MGSQQHTDMKLVRRSRDRVSFHSLAQLFADIRIVCSDGVFLWNRSLLAASSPFLEEVLSEDDSFIILDSFSLKNVRHCFSTLCTNSELVSNESLLDVLLINRAKKTLDIKDDYDLNNELKTATTQITLKEEDNSSDSDNEKLDGSDFDCHPELEVKKIK